MIRQLSPKWRVAAVCGAGLFALVAFMAHPAAECNSPPVHGPRSLRLLLMRHAQSENNAAPWHRKLFRSYLDPAITSKGRRQALAARDALAGWDVDLVVSSQLMRAMQTAALTFGKRVHVAPYIGEAQWYLFGAHSCFWAPGGCARDRSEQRARLDDKVAALIDWSMVGGPDGDNSEAAMGPPSWERFVAAAAGTADAGGSTGEAAGRAPASSLLLAAGVGAGIGVLVGMSLRK